MFVCVVSCLGIFLGKRIGDIFKIQSFSRVKTPGVHCEFYFILFSFFLPKRQVCENKNQYEYVVTNEIKK